MFFSIVIPIHNSEKYLKQCLDSILAQSSNDYEVILVNDGSTDNSFKICEEYCALDSRFHVIHRLKGEGAASARNAGTSIAKGKYIIYIDSDDYIENSLFLKDIKEQADKGFDIICYKFRKYYEEKKEMKKCSFTIPKFRESENISSYVKKLIRNDAFYCAPWTKAIKREIIINGNIKFKKGILSEDQEWYYHVLIKAKSIIGIDKSYIIYRQHGNSTSVSWSIKNLTDTIEILEFWKKEIEQVDLEYEYKEALLNSIAKLYCNLLVGYTRYLDKNKEKYYIKLKNLSDLMKFHENPRVNTFYKIFKVVGFKGLIFSLKIICKLR